MRRAVAGFTTVELLIAMQITLLLAGFIYAAYFFSAKLSATRRHKVELENTAQLCMRTLTQEILHAQQIVAANDSGLVLKNQREKVVAFAIQNGLLYRNQQPLHSTEVRIQQLVFRYAKTDSVVDHRMIKMSAPAYFYPQTVDELSQIALIEIALMVANDKKRVMLKSTLHPRNTRLRLFDMLPLESSYQ